MPNKEKPTGLHWKDAAKLWKIKSYMGVVNRGLSSGLFELERGFLVSEGMPVTKEQAKAWVFAKRGDNRKPGKRAKGKATAKRKTKVAA